MGKPKESLPFGGETLLARIAGELLACCDPVVVVGRGRDQQLPELPPPTRTVVDEQPDGGPLWGLCTGLRYLRRDGVLAPDDAVFVTGCDAPFVSRRVVTWLANALGTAPAVVPRIGGALQPLGAVYRLRVLDTVEDLLGRGVTSPRTLAEAVSARIVSAAELAAIDPDLRSVANLNTPDDYARALRSLDS